jgi:hypothetical protein
MAYGTVNADLMTTSDGVSAAGTYGFKNRIINGAMMVSQRGTAFATPANLAYTVDRWLVNWGGAAPSSVNQVAGPTGYKNALRLSGGASNTGLNTQQRIESLNCTDLSGATVTIQANIAVSSAQTIGWALQYATATDNFASTTSIATGTWSATTTATVFTATITNLPAGALNGLALLISPNNGAGLTSGTVDITGVQLEKGSTATSFDYRPYGTELQLCMRYYQGATDGNNSNKLRFIDYKKIGVVAGDIRRDFIPFKVPMNKTPTMTFDDNNGNSGKVYWSAVNNTASVYSATADYYVLVSTSAAGTSSSVSDFVFNYVLSAEL